MVSISISVGGRWNQDINQSNYRGNQGWYIIGLSTKLLLTCPIINITLEQYNKLFDSYRPEQIWVEDLKDDLLYPNSKFKVGISTNPEESRIFHVIAYQGPDKILYPPVEDIDFDEILGKEIIDYEIPEEYQVDMFEDNNRFFLYFDESDEYVSVIAKLEGDEIVSPEY